MQMLAPVHQWQIMLEQPIKSGMVQLQAWWKSLQIGQSASIWQTSCHGLLSFRFAQYQIAAASSNRISNGVADNASIGLQYCLRDFPRQFLRRIGPDFRERRMIMRQCGEFVNGHAL